MVTNTGQIFDAAATDQNNRVLLKVMTLTGNIGGYFEPVRKADTGDFPERRVRLFGRRRVHACANPPLLRTAFHRWHFIPNLSLIHI